MKARAHKDHNAKENVLRTLAKLFEIIWNYSTKLRLHPNILRSVFCPVFFFFELIAMAIAVAASSSFSIEIEIQEFK